MSGRTALAAIVTATIVGLALLIGVFVVGSFFESAPSADNGEVLEYETTDQYYELGGATAERGINERVWDSTGYAVDMDGSGSWRSTADVDWSSNGTWSVTAWAAADGGASGERAVTSLDGNVVVTYNASSDEWRAWYYDAGSTDSWDVTVAAQSQPGDLEPVMVSTNETHMTIEAGDPAATNSVELTNNTITASPNASGWDGQIDEFRTFDDPLNQSQRDELRADPIVELSGANQTSRAMFDEWWREDGRQSLFDAPGEIELTGDASLERSGVDGTLMERDTDYAWRESGPQVGPLSTGDLSDREILYAAWDNSETSVDDVQNDWLEFVNLAATLLLVLLAAAVVTVVRRMQQ